MQQIDTTGAGANQAVSADSIVKEGFK